MLINQRSILLQAISKEIDKTKTVIYKPSQFIIIKNKRFFQQALILIDIFNFNYVLIFQMQQKQQEEKIDFSREILFNKA